MQMKFDEKDIERFWSKIDKTTGCWFWTGCINIKGYGRFHIGSTKDGSRQAVSAHRFAYTITFGIIPNNLFVCHRCDTPSCCRPEHLFVGTDADNQRDAATKGRMPCGDQHWSRRCPDKVLRGENQPRAKLDEGRVRAIRKRHAEGELERELGVEYGVSRMAISSIVCNKNWGHIHDE